MDQKSTPQLNYFGTDNRTHGHYIWAMGESNMGRSNLDFHNWPFNPQDVAKLPGTSQYSSDTGLKKGEAKFFSLHGHSIWYIEGSAIDNRRGTKSVWWIKGDVKPEELKEIILANVPSKILIDMMEKKFPINWSYENKGN